MEGDIPSLTKQLRETEDQLRVAKDQLRVQSRRARQLVAAFTVKLQDKEREMQTMRILKDGQLQSIIRKLLHFESLLKQEQKRIASVVAEKDAIITEQTKEIERLNRKLMVHSSTEEEGDVPQPSAKVPKLQPDSTAAGEDKENSRVSETPTVTRIVRKFEATVPGKKPEVPKKPARIAQLKPRPPPEMPPAAASNQGPERGVSRKDSVNDHGYFTLEKRKPLKNVTESVAGSGSLTTTKTKMEDETDLRQNFEEFHLDSLEEEHLYEATNEDQDHRRSGGDGAEIQTAPETPKTSISSSSILLPQLGDLTPNPAPFDRFLEMTGLTQKSILTPSRLLSNHKNMLKPKDVKHRSRVKAAVLNTSQVRYYVEPYL